MHSEKDFIERCINNDAKAQEALYRRYSPKMFGVCLRFAKNKIEAEEILQEGFIKIFANLKNFRYEGSFEGWIRRTIINTAINYFKKKSRRFVEVNIEDIKTTKVENESVIDKISVNELLKLIQTLPNGYRTVFNLNVIEGYTHKEIGKKLSISENTSKSQLSRARAILQKKVVNLINVGL